MSGILFQLSLQALKQGERVGCSSGKSADYTAIAQAPHFLNSTLAKISDLAADPQVQQTMSGYIDTYLAHGGNPPPFAEAKSTPSAERALRFRAVAGALDTCTGPHESCCPAPQDDVNNCPDSSRTLDCDAKKSCCCG